MVHFSLDKYIGIEVVEIVEKIGERKDYIDYKKDLDKIIKKIVFENNQLKGDIKTPEQVKKMYNKEEISVEEKNIEENKLINKLNKLIYIPRVIESIYEKIIITEKEIKNIYGIKIADEKHREIVIRVSILKIIFDNKYKLINEKREIIEEIFKHNDKYSNGMITVLDYVLEFWMVILDIKTETEKRLYSRLLENFREDEEISKFIDEFEISKVKKEEVYVDLVMLSKYYRIMDLKDNSIKIYKELREKIFEMEKEDYIKTLSLYEIAELEKRYNAGKKIEKSIYDRYNDFEPQAIYESIIYFNFQKLYLKDFELFYKKFNEEKRKLLNKMGGTDFIIGISEQFKKSEEIKKIIEKRRGFDEKADRDAEIVKIEEIFMEEIEKRDVEGKEEIKISIINFFYIFKKLITEGKEEKKVKKLLLSFKDKKYFEQRDLLNNIRKNVEFKEYKDLNKEIINILPDVKVEFYNVLNIVKDRAAKTENQ